MIQTNIKKLDALIAAFNVQKENKQVDFELKDLLFIYTLIAVPTATIYSRIINEIKIDEETLNSILSFLVNIKILSNKELKTLQKNFKRDFSKYNKMDLIYSNIVSYYNKITNKKTRGDNKSKLLLRKWITMGYTEKDMKQVIYYYYHEWKDKPEMVKYINLTTLLNDKFEQRLENAKSFLSTLNAYYQDLFVICKSLKDYLTKKPIPTLEVDLNKLNDNNDNQDLCNIIPFENRQTLLHWLTLGYKANEIADTIIASIESWSKKEELKPYINLNTILNNKFPARYKAYKARLNKKKNIKKGLWK